MVEILRRCREKHGTFYGYDETAKADKGAYTVLDITCPEHGVYQQTAIQHYKGARCRQCAAAARSKKKSITGDELYEKFVDGGANVHDSRYLYRRKDFMGKTARDKVTITCPDHGPFEQTYNSHIMYGQGCRRCSIERIFTDKRKAERRERLWGTVPERRKQFLAEAKKHHGDTYKYPYLRAEFVQGHSLITVVCPECGPFRQPAYIHARGHGCRNCWRSTVERSIERYVRKLLPETEKVLHSDRKAIRPYELDVYIPSRKLAIEYGAVVWHEEGRKGLSYHATKQKMCQKAGITLLTIFDIDWSDASKRKIIRNRIKSALGLVKKSVYGRNCTAVSILSAQAKEFLSANHLQGYRAAKVHIGLFDNKTNALVSVASFGKPRFSKAHEWELIRFASSAGLSVVGGLSKAVAYFERTAKPQSIVSYADLRWGTGKSYERAGFSFSHRTSPARWYAHRSGADGRMLHRMHVQRHRLPVLLGNGFNPAKSAEANLRENGYLSIGDCGNNVYTWMRPDSASGQSPTIH